MPQAETEALLARVAAERQHVDLLVKSITDENEQLRAQVAEAAKQIGRAGALASALIAAVLEVEDKLSEAAKEALAEYEALHGTAVSDAHRLRQAQERARRNEP